MVLVVLDDSRTRKSSANQETGFYKTSEKLTL
jgi:hypothetical protein